MPNNDDISYLLDDINRKLFLLAAFKIPNKADKLIDAIMADVERVRGRMSKEKESNGPKKTANS